jgi:thiol-disulfide isomerase/thioredoxin
MTWFPFRRVGVYLISMSALTLVAGCGQTQKPPEFSGTRYSTFANGAEMLVVKQDGTYQQRIATKSRKMVYNANRWTFGAPPPNCADSGQWIVLNKSIVPWDWCSKPSAKVSYVNLLIPTSGFNNSGDGSAGQIMWRGDVDSAEAEARSDKKLVMIDFYADTCGWCHKMDTDVYPNRSVIKAASRFVPVRINAEQDGVAVAQKYNITGFPTIVILDSSGQEVHRIDGYEEAGDFAAELVQVADSNL